VVALRSGFSHATKELVFYTDGDGQYDVFELRRFLPIMQEGVDVVNGYKIARSDPLHRVIIGVVYLRLMRLLFNFKARDIDCDFRLLRRAVFDTIALEHDTRVDLPRAREEARARGISVRRVPVHHYHRALRTLPVLPLSGGWRAWRSTSAVSGGH
jgi:glycosyltransferase involved in cell wall biosynthesis